LISKLEVFLMPSLLVLEEAQMQLGFSTLSLKILRSELLVLKLEDEASISDLMLMLRR
jgi:hypothetical protein